jgi:hypothetical protein
VDFYASCWKRSGVPHRAGSAGPVAGAQPHAAAHLREDLKPASRHRSRGHGGRCRARLPSRTVCLPSPRSTGAGSEPSRTSGARPADLRFDRRDAGCAGRWHPRRQERRLGGGIFGGRLGQPRLRAVRRGSCRRERAAKQLMLRSPPDELPTAPAPQSISQRAAAAWLGRFCAEAPDNLCVGDREPDTVHSRARAFDRRGLP